VLERSPHFSPSGCFPPSIIWLYLSWWRILCIRRPRSGANLFLFLFIPLRRFDRVFGSFSPVDMPAAFNFILAIICSAACFLAVFWRFFFLHCVVTFLPSLSHPLPLQRKCSLPSFQQAANPVLLSLLRLRKNPCLLFRIVCYGKLRTILLFSSFFPKGGNNSPPLPQGQINPLFFPPQIPSGHKSWFFLWMGSNSRLVVLFFFDTRAVSFFLLWCGRGASFFFLLPMAPISSDDIPQGWS